MHLLPVIRTCRFTLGGEAQAMLITSALVHASQWFSVLPLPCDRWEIEVKEENRELVRSLCETLRIDFLGEDPS